jgi:hypothetical protein
VASFEYCINLAVDQKKISKTTANEILESGDPAEYIKTLADNISRQKREKIIDAIIIADSRQKIMSHPKGPMVGLKSLLARDLTESAGYLNVENHQAFFLAKYWSSFHKGAERFFPRLNKMGLLGFRQDKEGLKDFVKVVFNTGFKSADNEINDLAKLWLDTVEEMRLDFNSFGGSISKNEAYFMPQAVNSRAFNKISEDEFVEFLNPTNGETLLDKSRMLNDKGERLTEEELNEALRYVYQTHKTAGLNKVKDAPPKGASRKLSRRNSHQRFLYFKDGESWIQYQDRFNGGDIYSIMTDHIQNMASDIGMMATLGTNPRNMFDTLSLLAQQEAAKQGKRYKGHGREAEAIFRVVSGEVNAAEMATFADLGNTFRTFESFAALGGAAISAVVDPVSNLLSAYSSKMPMMKVFSSHVKLLKDLHGKDSPELRQLFAEMGFIVDTTIGFAKSSNKYVDVYGTGKVAKGLDGLLRGTGLETMTQAGRKAMSMELSLMLHKNFGKKLSELDPVHQKMFASKGITEAEWDAFRATKPLEMKGVKFANVLEDKSMKFHAMITEEVERGVPLGDARIKAITTLLGTKRGTVGGELARSVTQLLTHPTAIIMNHANRLFHNPRGRSRVSYAAGGFVGFTMLGAISLQLSEMSKGKTPRDMDNARFWLDAFKRGGVGGPAADILFTNTEDFGKGFVEANMGLVFNRIDEVADMTVGNINRLIDGDETHLIPQFSKLAQDLTPKPWQLGLFHDYVFYNLRDATDPKHAYRFNKHEREIKKEQGQEYYFTPERSPLENIERIID